MYSGKLKVPRRLYEARRDRLKRLIDLNAPDCIIDMGAHLLAECFKYSLADRFYHWRINRCPGWFLWLTSKDYRDATKDPDLREFEQDMINTFSKEQ